MISKWEAAAEKINPRPVNQEALDTSLAKCTEDEATRFALLLAGTPGPVVMPAAVAPMLSYEQARHPIDGKLMTLVPSGVFLSGRDNEPVWLDAFYIDVYPTTNADYERFVSATGHPPPGYWADGRYPAGLDDHPVVFITWHDATAYAQWAGKLLPDSQQWEKAARGTRGEVYPWGTSRPPPSATPEREASAPPPPSTATTAASAHTASTTSAATPGSGARPRPNPVATS